MSELWAHSVNPVGHRHGLADHLRGTARLAGDFAEVFGARELAAYLGLVHDVGKGTCSWQGGLLRAEVSGGRVVDVGGRSIDHKAAGTWLAAREAGLGVFAMAVLGHHGGLGSLPELNECVRSAAGDSRALVDEAVDRVAQLVPEIRPIRRPSLPGWVEAAKDQWAAELLLRMAFSALVDADYLDTELHFEGAPRPASVSLASLAETFEANRKEFLAKPDPSPVDAIRAEVYEQVLAAAVQPVGIFPFPAPTGAGKTIGAGGFAVEHAAFHGLRRVIVAVPYLSITEQNAEVYRRLFGDQHVLEHHSGIDLHDLPANRRWQLLAAENWDAPVVVTTTVRLFESLFSRKPSAMRKLHRLAGSVIVLDEVQSLPDRLLVPILSGLRHLTEFFGSSVLLASATQPDFFGLKVFQDLRPREVIARPQPLYDRLRRVGYQWRCDPKPTFAEIAAQSAGEPRALLIVNTTGDAAKLHRLLSEESSTEGRPVLHLSTRMAAAHRRVVLARVRKLLKAEDPVTVVSTQLVEAGVDLDFPVVFRAFAAAEALQQAAGRANRNGVLAEGRVVVFDPADGSETGARKVYGAALDLTRHFFGPGRADPDDLAALNAYYRARYAVSNIEGSSVGAEIQNWRKAFNFREVAARFQMIDELTVPVLVRYGDDAEREDLRKRLVSSDRVEGWVYRRIQPYLAALPKRLAGRAVRDGLATVLVGDLHEWHGIYHEHRGIEFTSPDPEEYVW